MRRPFAHISTTQKPFAVMSIASAFDEVGSLFVSNSNPMMSSTGLPGEDRILTNGNPCLSFAASTSTARANSSTADSGLFSHETLDRSSPDLWPEQIPGVTEFIARNNSPLHGLLSTKGEDVLSDEDGAKEWLGELDQEDMNMLHSFGSLTTSALLDKVKELQDLAYQLGIDEAREMTRGKFLDILSKRDAGRDTSNGYSLTPLSSPISSFRRDSLR